MQPGALRQILPVLLLAAALIAARPGRAGTIVNLDATNTDGAAFVVSPILQAGSYAVDVVGIAGGGQYNAFTYEAPTAANPAVYSDAFSICTYNCVVSNPDAWNAQFAWGGAYASYEADLPTGIWGYDTDSEALAAWQSAGPFIFTLATAGSVTFAVDDFATYGDDTGGISLSYTAISVARSASVVPEPASLALALPGLAILATLRRRKPRPVPPARPA
jgi:MYXO-CTERM domain-containing protein